MSGPVARPAPRWQAGALALLALVLGAVFWMAREHLALQRLERLMLDAQFQLRGPLPPGTAQPVALVAVDDRTLQALGGAPGRAHHAQLLQRLRAAGARVVALDVLFLEPGRTPEDLAADQALAEALQGPGMAVLLPFFFADSGSAPPDLLGQAYARSWAPPARQALLPLHPQGLGAPLPALRRAAQGLGHVSALRAGDGAVPHDLPALPLEGEWWPSLALRVAGAQLGLAWPQAELRLGEAVRWGPLHLPLDARSRQGINYLGEAGTLPHHSYLDVLQGRVGAAALEGRAVIVGATATGTVDAFATPFDAGLPGAERLGTVVDNLLTGRSLRAAPPWLGLAAALLLPLLSLALVSQERLLRGLSLWVGGGLLLLAGMQWEFAHAQRVHSLVPALLASLLVAALALSLRARSELVRRQAALAALQASEARYALAARGANDGLWDWDLQTAALYLSERARSLLGPGCEAREPALALGAPLDDAARRSLQQAIDDHLAGRSLQLHEMLQFREGGQERALLLRGSASRDAQGRATRMAGSLTDVSDLHQLQQQLAHDALHDRLTGLPNRRFFLEQLAHSCSGTTPLGVALLGLDGFRSLNELEGPAAGDAVLRAVADRLQATLAPAQLLARLGPDVFALAYQAEPDGAQAQALLALLQPPLRWGERTLPLAGTVGWAHRSQGPQGAEELLACAELALALGKASARGSVRAYDVADQLRESSRRWLRDHLERGLAEQQFRLYYQPLVRLADRRLLGFEALIRWQHPERGFVMPGDFIPFAEESGQIVPLGRWTLIEAARQLQRWAQIGFEGEIAVNLSGRQFVEGDLQGDARDAIACLQGLDPHRLKLEVTESMAMANPAHTAEALQALARMGFKISIDDFGTGYSSLAYLHQFPFDTLKIDRSFVMRLHAGRDAVEIVRTIVGLTQALGKQALAEGVEEERQATLLHELGVQIGQGWLFGKALPVAQAEALIARQLRDGHL